MTEEEMLAIEDLVEFVDINSFDVEIDKTLFIVKEMIKRWNSA